MLNDVKNLKESGNASLAELRDFLKGLKTRTPQEVIGIVSTSLLVQSLAISCVVTIGLMVVFTIVPYLVYGPNQPQSASSKPAKPATTAGSEAKSAANETPGATAVASDTANPTANSGADAAKAAKVMGLDETKPADPKRNPLDKPDLDKLLDGL
jgi:hypothetical protein